MNSIRRFISDHPPARAVVVGAIGVVAYPLLGFGTLVFSAALVDLWLPNGDFDQVWPRVVFGLLLILLPAWARLGDPFELPSEPAAESGESRASGFRRLAGVMLLAAGFTVAFAGMVGTISLARLAGIPLYLAGAVTMILGSHLRTSTDEAVADLRWVVAPHERAAVGPPPGCYWILLGLVLFVVWFPPGAFGVGVLGIGLAGIAVFEFLRAGLHEGGHWILARAAGMESCAVRIGAGDAWFRTRIARTVVELRGNPLGGKTSVRPDPTRPIRRQLLLLAAGGPLADLLLLTMLICGLQIFPDDTGAVSAAAYWVALSTLVSTGSAARTTMAGERLLTDGWWFAQTPRLTSSTIAEEAVTAVEPTRGSSS